MALKPMPGWLQGGYTLASLPAAVQRSLNLFPEVNEIPVEKSVGYMRGCPGLSTALLTLPTYPLRGLLAAGTPLYPQNGSGGRMFAVAGSKLYEVFASVVTTTGTSVAWVGGSLFYRGMKGQSITINGVVYTVATYVSTISITLTATAGNQTAVPAGSIAGIYTLTGTVDTSGTAVTAGGGTVFYPGMEGQRIKINTVFYTVSSVTDSTHLVLTATAGVQTGVAVLGVFNGIGGRDRGDVGNDGLPATLIPNGTQLGIVSNGLFYCDNGSGAAQPLLAPSQGSADTFASVGTCSVTAGVVTWATASAGNYFNALQIGDLITIDGVARYVALTVPSTTVTTLYLTDATVTTGAGVAYTAYAAAPISGSTTVFPSTLAVGNKIVINAAAYTIAYIPSLTGRLCLTTTPGNQTNVAWIVNALNATVSTDGGTPTTVTWISGDGFPIYGLLGAQGFFNGFGGAANIVTAVLSSTSLQVAGPTGPSTTIAFGINPLLVASTGTFLDSFFIISPPSSKLIQVSAPNDGTAWDAADVAAKESYPDNIGKLLADHEECFVLGEARSEVWRAPGADPNFPFQRDPGACISMGISAPDSACVALQGVCWIGGDTRGQPVAYYAQGFVPQRISTHAVEQAWASYSTVADAAGFVYELDGHVLWQIGFPTADATWVYDFTSSAQMGKPMWHERNSWDGSAFHRHRASCHAFVFGRHWVGDFSNGKIYEMDSDIYTDAGQMITCIRTLPHLCEQRLREFFTKLQIDLETGGGVALVVTVEWSDDGGASFVGGGAEFTYTTSTTQTLDRADFWRMGSADQGDRVYKITVTGDARKALVNCYLDSVVGIS